MIKRLRRQLTALFTITTGLILTLVVIGILVISAREFNKKNLDSFQNQILNITSRLQSGSTVKPKRRCKKRTSAMRFSGSSCV